MKRFAQAIAHFLIRLLYRPKVYYTDKALQDNHIRQPLILVCNHIHDFDGPVMTTIFKGSKIHNLAAKDRYDQKGMALLLRLGECIPIDRKNFTFEWIHQSMEVLKTDSVCIFPEGRHGHNGEILPFHTGMVALAALAKVPVLLVYIDGPYKPFGKRLKIRVDVPFMLDVAPGGKLALSPSDVHAKAALLEQKMRELQADFRATSSGGK